MIAPINYNKEELQDILIAVVRDLNMAQTILQLHGRMDLAHRLIEAALAVQNVYDVGERKQQEP